MTIRTLDGAQDDIDSTARRLERERPGFGAAFFALYQDARSALVAAPRQHSPTEDGPDGIETREVFLARFNQRVIYAVTDTEVVILAVVHAHSRPGAWAGRVDEIDQPSTSGVPMTATIDLPQDLIDRVGALSDAQRGRLFALFPAGDPELKADLTRRWERYKDGTDPSYTAEEVMAELRAQAAVRSQ